jgi:hypothetical protein
MIKTLYQPTTTNSIPYAIEIGMKGENYVLPFLQRNFPESKDIMNTKERLKNEFCGWDFDDEEDNRWEVKTRPDITHNKYLTMFISAHKMNHQAEGKKLYMVFNCVDGVWCVEYEKQLFDTFHISDNFDRRRNRWEKVVNIPHKYLRQLV